MNWIHLAQNTVWWRILVNAVMNFGFYKRRVFLDNKNSGPFSRYRQVTHHL
jgi:hypothetical protein